MSDKSLEIVTPAPTPIKELLKKQVDNNRPTLRCNIETEQDYADFLSLIPEPDRQISLRDTLHDTGQANKVDIDFGERTFRFGLEVDQNGILVSGTEVTDLIKLATIDPLTDLLNLKALTKQLNYIQDKINRHNDPSQKEKLRENDVPINAAILNGDVDGLKGVNDEFGHFGGDALIEATAELLKLVLRDDDDIFHPHGDEFLGIINNIPRGHTGEITTAIKSRIAENKLTVGELLKLKYKEELPEIYKNLPEEFFNKNPEISCGFAMLTENSKVHTVMAEADAEMYKAKQKRKQTTTTQPQS